jgi:hypothetical protein
MAWVDYQRKPTGISGKYGESLRVPEKWQIRVDSPDTGKAEILGGVSATIGITWGTPHWEFPALLAQEFDLQPETEDGMRWTLTVQYYVPPPGKEITENGIPKDVWERNGGTTSVPAFTDVDGETITNAAGDPLEGLEKEREETSWSLTKYYEDEASLDEDIDAAAGKVNSAEWAGQDAKTWKCYFKGAKKQSISKLDGDDDGGMLDFIESRWEFRFDPETWKTMPWDVGFMELSGSGEKKVITGTDGKAVKQPVALNSDGTKKAPGEKPVVINAGDGADLYETADFDEIFGPPELLSDGS